MSSRLARPQSRKVIAGVCAGLSDATGISVGIIRFLFLLFIPLAGPSVLVYLVLWLLMPKSV